jgi:acetyl esterase/lipase
VTTPALDPEIAAAIEPIGFFGGLTTEMLPTVREAGRFESPPLSERVVRTEVRVEGDPPVPVRIHREAGADELRPCLYSIHGGGYVTGSYDQDDYRFDNWCPQLQIVGASVDYRLAPETPYPGPLEDCYRGLVWVYEHAEEIGVDRHRIGIGGVSAGGGLAASLALLARDRGEVPVMFQLLDCPMLDDRQTTPSSQLEGLPIWSKESNTFGWRSYLGELYGSADVPYTAAPARCQNLSGLPPAFVNVGTVDGFRDEDIDYALRLNQAGVPCELHVYPGACHGYQFAANARISRQAARDVLGWLQVQLGRE